MKQKKIMGAVQKQPAKQHSQSSPIWVKMGWIGCANQQVTSKQPPMIFFIFSGYFFCMTSLRTHKPEMPEHFCHLIIQLQVVCSARSKRESRARAQRRRPRWCCCLCCSYSAEVRMISKQPRSDYHRLDQGFASWEPSGASFNSQCRICKISEQVTLVFYQIEP